MHKRKRAPTTKHDMPDNSTALPLDDKDEPHKEALQPRPNPPAKRSRNEPTKQSDEKKISNGSRKARTAIKVKVKPTTVASTLPPEIWRLVGMEILHAQTLKSLVRVSRAFHNIFTPLLHARRIVNLEYFPDSKPLKEIALPPYLEYVQDFRINIYEYRQTGTTYKLGRNDEYAAWIARALESTKYLRSFSWRDESFEDDYGPALILHNRNLLRTLKGVESLKHICFQFGAIIVNDPAPVRNCYIPLIGFRNMTSLELYDFYRNHNIFIKELSSFLCDSPSLKKLGLGFACDRTQDEDEAVIFGDLGSETDFLERLCEFYGSKCKTGPLALETLRLGAGIYLSEPSNPANNHYLTKLLSVNGLKILHIHNGLISSDFDEESFYQPIDWTPFPSAECRSLRQLSVSRLGEDVIDWLSQDGNRVEELIVTDHYRFNDKDLKQFFKLPSSRLSMLWTREKYPWRSGSYDDSDSDWTDTDSSLDDWSDADSLTSGQSTVSQSTQASLGSQLSDVFTPQSHDPDPTAQSLDKRVMTVLDRLPDGGSHLERLCIALDFEVQWRHFSSHLKNLGSLTQLRINAKSWLGGEFPTIASSIWPDVTEDTPNEELARRFAVLISSKCPTLRYIMIGHDSVWEVIRPKAEHVGIRTRSQSSISLRELDNEEILAIELFALTDFPEQGGMLGRKRDRKEKYVGKVQTIREINAMLIAQGIPPLPV